MVRQSSGQDVQQPYTLVVFYNSRVYNIPIRFVPSTRQYALGREKKGEEVRNQCVIRPFHFSLMNRITKDENVTLFVLKKKICL